MNVVDMAAYREAVQSREFAVQAERKAEVEGRANLEWVLADLLADIQAA